MWDNEAVDEQPVSAQSLHRPLLLWSLPFVFLSFGLPIYSKALGASALEIGGLFSAFTATTIVLRPIVGWAVDRYGRKRFLVIALWIYALAMAAFALADSLAGLYLARFIQGAGSSFLWIAVNTVVADLTEPDERGRALGAIDQVTARGGIIGIFAGFFLISNLPEDVNWQMTFLAYTLTAAVAAWLAWRNVPETKPVTETSFLGRRSVSRQLIPLMLIVLVTGTSEGMIGPIYLIFLQDKFTTDIGSLALAFLPAGLVAAFLAARLGGLSDRLGRVPMMVLGLMASGLLSFLLPNVPSLVWLAVIYALSAGVWAVSEPAEGALVADLTGIERRGVGYGLYDLAGSVGFTIGPLLGGSLYDAIGRAVPFYLNGGVLLVSAVAVALFLRQHSVSGVSPSN